jgi:hypothetical protein
MAWARLDDMLPMHPKVRALSDAAFRLYICAICWSNLHLSDGYIPSQHLRYMSDVRRPQQCAEQLVQADLWEKVDDGWWIHDYLQYQPSAEKVRQEREAKQQRQERWRAKRDASHDASEDESKDASSRARTHPIPSRSGSVGIQPADRNGQADPDLTLIRAVQQAMAARTQRRVTDEQAEYIAAQIIGSENVRNPVPYVTTAINRDPNPRRFLPPDHPSAKSLSAAVSEAGIPPGHKPARGATVTRYADAIRQSITKPSQEPT